MDALSFFKRLLSLWLHHGGGGDGDCLSAQKKICFKTRLKTPNSSEMTGRTMNVAVGVQSETVEAVRKADIY